MLHSCFPSLVGRPTHLRCIFIGCLKLQPCRNYSNRYIMKKLQRLTLAEQYKDFTSVSSCLDISNQCPQIYIPSRKHHLSVLNMSTMQTYTIHRNGFCTDPTSTSQDAKKVDKKISTKRVTREPFLGKEILRKIKKKQTEQFFTYTDNNFMDVESAMEDFLLDKSDIDKIITFKRTSPYSSRHHALNEEENFLECAWSSDIHKLAIEKWGSMEQLKLEKKIRQYRGWPRERGKLGKKDTSLYVKLKQAFGKDSGVVVLVALLMNVCNAGFKGAVWYFTGSPSMFSEFMHSVGDTSNQLFLAIGRYLSLQNPDALHPYGYRNHIHIWSILSGVIIFSLGCGFTAHHAIHSLWNPIIMEYNQLVLALCVLGGTFLTESASLAYAVLEIRKKAMLAGMTVWSYVKDGDDPLCNVVLMEDTAGVLGVMVCGAAMTGSYLMGVPQLDAIGSLIISGMMGAVSAFLFKTNMDKLVGKAIPYEDKIIEELEKDRFVHAVWDHKSQDFGDQSRFKSEIVLDARLVTSHFLDTEVDVDAMLVKWMSIKTTEDMTLFLEDFGINVYNQIVAHVDRKEKDIKRLFPEVRHIDIEPS